MTNYDETGITGVYKETLPGTRYRGKHDIAYYIEYMDGEKRIFEHIGRASDGYSVNEASIIRKGRILESDKRIHCHLKSELTFGMAWEIALNRHFKMLSDCSSNENRYKTYLEKTLGKMHLSEIKSDDVERIKLEQLCAGKADETVRKIVWQIGRVYNLVIKWKLWCGENPALDVVWRKRDNKRTRYLTKDEARKLMLELERRSPYIWKVAMTSLYTGMRANEILSLRTEHVDRKTGLIKVVDTKNGHNRVVYICKRLEEMLKEHEPDPCGLFFPRPRGGSYGRVSRVFARTVEDLGLNKGRKDRLEHVVFHTLRHTFASWLVSSGVPIHTISMLMGHRTPGQTERYAHLKPEVMRTALMVLDNIDLYPNTKVGVKDDGENSHDVPEEEKDDDVREKIDLL